MALPPTDELLIQVSPDDSKQLYDIRKSFKAYKQQYEDIPQAENYTLNSATYRSPHMVHDIGNESATSYDMTLQALMEYPFRLNVADLTYAAPTNGNTEIATAWNNSAHEESTTNVSSPRPTAYEGDAWPARLGPLTRNQMAPAALSPHATMADLAHQEEASHGQQRRPPKFLCPQDNCGRRKTAFTTAYRLKTHINRYHTSPSLQKRYECGLGTCGYTTLYSTDLPRHRKTCKQRSVNFAVDLHST